MLKNEDIICISSIDWDFIWQGHQEIMSTFAKQGNRVLFIENTGIRTPNFQDISRIRKRLFNWFKSIKGFRQVEDNLYVYSPLILPFQYSQWARVFNRYFMLFPLRRWLDVMSFDRPIVWTFLPTQTALDVIDWIKGKILVYYYIADFDHLVKDVEKLRVTEEILMKKCDVIFAQGDGFKKKCLKFNKNVFVFPFGVNTEKFEITKEDEASLPPKELENLPKPILGYIGGIHRHVDFDLIRHTALEFPQALLVMVGPIQTDLSPIEDIKNIIFTGKKDFSELPSYIRAFDVCLVPYTLSNFTKTVYPTKINEYHAMGKPVVSTNLPEVCSSNTDHLIYMSKSYDEFCRNIKQALQERDCMLVQARVRSAKTNSWSLRIEEMSQKIEYVDTLRTLKPFDKWREKFSEIYSRSRRKVLKIVCVVFLFWGAIFYTPLMWYLAEPLKIKSGLYPSDAIVVFAGGGGESGEVKQGYEERVAYAVELFERGLSPYLLFSSGSKSTYFETFIMKTLAISLGIPPERIILEDKAASTYQNVKFSAEILDQKHWNQIILVSSPYHMLRSSLIFKKISPQREVFYAPIPVSRFYHRSDRDEQGKKKWRQINAEQLKALLHEYLAIVYYWWKHYI